MKAIYEVKKPDNTVVYRAIVKPDGEIYGCRVFRRGAFYPVLVGKDTRAELVDIITDEQEAQL